MDYEMLKLQKQLHEAKIQAFEAGIESEKAKIQLVEIKLEGFTKKAEVTN